VAKKFDISVIFKAIDKATPTLKKIGRSINKVGKEFSETLVSSAKIGAAAMTAFAGVAAKNAAEFQDSMNFVGAVTNANTEDFIRLKNAAKEMGEETQFSARQAAEGLKEFGLAGFGVVKSIAALPKTLELATAAQLDIGDAARIVTGVMASYEFQAKDLGKINDVLVNAFTKAKVSLPFLGEAFTKIGTKAKTLGVEFDEVIAALQILGEKNIDASVAGSGLRRMFTELQDPTKKQRKVIQALNLEFRKTDGSIKGITGIVREFEKALDRGVDKQILLTAATQIFGAFGSEVIIPIWQKGSKEINRYRKGLKETGISQRIATAQMKGLGGAFKLLVSKIEAVQITMFETDNAFGRFFEKQVRNAGQMAGAFNKWLNSLDSSVYKSFIAAWKRFSVVVFGFGEGIRDTVKFLGQLAKDLGFFNDTIPDQEELESLRELGKLLGIAFGVAAAAAMARFVTPWTAFITGLIWLVQNWDKVAKFFEKIGKDIGDAPIVQAIEKLSLGEGERGVFGTEGGRTFVSEAEARAFRGRQEELARVGGEKSEITIKVEAEQGTSAGVTEVKKSNNTRLIVDTKTGMTLGVVGAPIPVQ
jgi:TP901 family phage tail tape measure protein